MELTKYEKKGTKIIAHVKAHEESEIVFPLFGFDGYAAELNGEPLQWTRGENNRIAVKLPAGADGELHVWFEGKTEWKIADLISLLSVIGYTGYALKKNARKKCLGNMLN